MEKTTVHYNVHLINFIRPRGVLPPNGQNKLNVHFKTNICPTCGKVTELPNSVPAAISGCLSKSYEQSLPGKKESPIGLWTTILKPRVCNSVVAVFFVFFSDNIWKKGWRWTNANTRANLLSKVHPNFWLTAILIGMLILVGKEQV